MGWRMGKSGAEHVPTHVFQFFRCLLTPTVEDREMSTITLKRGEAGIKTFAVLAASTSCLLSLPSNQPRKLSHPFS